MHCTGILKNFRGTPSASSNNDMFCNKILLLGQVNS